MAVIKMAGLKKGVNDLKTWCRNNGEFGERLTREWTGECKDGKTYTIDNTTFTSDKQFKWVCDENKHEWVDSIISRTESKSLCKYCRQIKKPNTSLQAWCSRNGEYGQLLVSEWTGQCADRKHYNMYQVTCSSTDKFLWVCSEGHTWVVSVGDRVCGRTKCPLCERKVPKSKTLGKRTTLKSWCIGNGEFGKMLMHEWTGRSTNGVNYSIDNVSYCSNSKVIWRCQAGHEWVDSIAYRTVNRSVCKKCSVVQSPLSRWCSINGDFGELLSSEWTGLCEDGEIYSIDQIAYDSKLKFVWKCSEGHAWDDSVCDRVLNRTECMQCSRKAITKPKPESLSKWCSENGNFGDLIKSEWLGISWDGKTYSIDDVTYRDIRKFKWRCCNGHEWMAPIRTRVTNKTQCPTCKVLLNANNLEAWCRTSGEAGQRLIREWTGECENGTHLEMRLVPENSKFKFKWRCSEGHEWYATVRSRTNMHSYTSLGGCPVCMTKPPSYPVQVIYFCLKQIFPNAEMNCNVLRTPTTPKGVTFHIAVPEVPLCIEYLNTSDMGTHNGKHTRRYNEQEYKRKLCKAAKVKFIQIVENAAQRKDGIVQKNNVLYIKPNTKDSDVQMHELVASILSIIGQPINSIDFALALQNAWLSIDGTTKYSESIECLYPLLAMEWHTELNKHMKPSQVKPTLNRSVYWVCPNCGRGANGNWRSNISLRVRTKSGCSRCGYNWFRAQQGLP